jgi:hypothetical protein
MKSGFFLTSPMGESLEVPAKLYNAFHHFMKNENHPSGTVTVYFSGGGDTLRGTQGVAKIVAHVEMA